MNLLYAFAFLLIFQDTPFKKKEEFDVKLNFEFRQRPSESNTYTYRYQEKTDRSTPMLPYLTIDLKLNKLNTYETRIRIVNSKQVSVFTKKAQEGLIIKLDLGFTDDLKDRVTSHEYIALLLNTEKNPVSRIVISFEEDGSYFVNGEKRGKI